MSVDAVATLRAEGFSEDTESVGAVGLAVDGASVRGEVLPEDAGGVAGVRGAVDARAESRGVARCRSGLPVNPATRLVG